MNYQQAIYYLNSYTDYEKIPSVAYREENYNPRRLEVLLARFGEPHRAARTVQVAGTKGKGSTSAMIASVLTASGYRTALYTSPHLQTIRERMRVDGEMITEPELAAIMTRLLPEIERVNSNSKLGRLTTFEVLTAIAFIYFKQREVEFQVLEVGLGGRLDATSVVNPEVCAITSVSLDHTDVLGNSLTAIAREKAGIIKPGCTVVTAPQTPEVMKEIRKASDRVKAEMVRVGKDVNWRWTSADLKKQSMLVVGRLGRYQFSIPLLGDFQVENACVAIASLEALMSRGVALPKKAIRQGMGKVSWPGRFQILRTRPALVVDGAHNVYSLQQLIKSLRQYFDFRQAILVMGASGDKDVEGMVAEVAPFFHRVVVTSADHPRAAKPARLAGLFEKHGLKAEEKASVPEAVSYALSVAGKGDVICVTGSLFVVAEALASYAAQSA